MTGVFRSQGTLRPQGGARGTAGADLSGGGGLGESMLAVRGPVTDTDSTCIGSVPRVVTTCKLVPCPLPHQRSLCHTLTWGSCAHDPLEPPPPPPCWATATPPGARELPELRPPTRPGCAPAQQPLGAALSQAPHPHTEFHPLHVCRAPTPQTRTHTAQLPPGPPAV